MLTIPHPDQSQPQRRPTPVRPRRDTSTSAPATAAAEATRTAAAQNLAGPARQDPPHRSAASGAQPYTVPAEQPVRRPGPVRCPRSGRTACATRGASRSTASPATSRIGDVGQNAYEEIDYRPVDAGWGRGGQLRLELHSRAGTSTRRQPVPNPPNHTSAGPRVHPRRGGACSITGGYVVTRPGSPEPARPLPLQRLLQRDDLLEHPSDPGRDKTIARNGLDAVQHDLVRRGLVRPRLRGRRRRGPERLAHPATTRPADSAWIPRYNLPVLTASVSRTTSRSTCSDPNGQELDGGTRCRRARTSSSSTTTGRFTTSISRTPRRRAGTVGFVRPEVTELCSTSIDGTGHETWTVNFTTGGDRSRISATCTTR